MNNTPCVKEAVKMAIETGDIKTVFQPIVTIKGEICGFEALSRFSNGCSPDIAWAHARRRHLAVALDQIAVRAALSAARSLDGILYLNVSSGYFRHPQSLMMLANGRSVVWEVGERTFLTQEEFAGVLQLKQWGQRIAMDDAGSGHSTVERLNKIRPEIVKLDRSIVFKWAQGKTESLRQWIYVAKQIKARVIAEGIEDTDWIAGLAEAGVDALQGFALGRPAPVEQYLTRQMTEYSGG